MAFPLIPLAIGVLGGLAKRMRRNRQLKQQSNLLTFQDEQQENRDQPASASVTLQPTPPADTVSNAAAAEPNQPSQDTQTTVQPGGSSEFQERSGVSPQQPQQQQGGVQPVGQQTKVSGLSAAAMGAASKAKSRKKNLAAQAALLQKK